MIAVAALMGLSSSAAAAGWYLSKTPVSSTAAPTSNVSNSLAGYSQYAVTQGAFIRSLTGPSPDACAQSCQDDTSCATWVYDQVSTTCSMYQGNPTTSTFYKQNDKGKTFSTFDFGSGYNLDGDVSACAKECNGNTSCLGFQFSSDPFPGCLVYSRGGQSAQVYGFPNRGTAAPSSAV